MELASSISALAPATTREVRPSLLDPLNCGDLPHALGSLARTPAAQPLTQPCEQDEDHACKHIIETFQHPGTSHSDPL